MVRTEEASAVRGGIDMKKMCVIFKVNDNADLSKVTLTFKDKNGDNPNATIYRNLRAVNVDDRFLEEKRGVKE